MTESDVEFMKLTMLGTGNAVVTECYNTCFVIEENHEYLLVDGGGGNAVLHQLKAADIDWKNIRHIFVTHKHVDHILGIIWLVRMITQNMNRNNYTGEAYIYGHDEVIFLIKDMAEKLLSQKETAFIGNRLHLVAIEDGQELSVLGSKIKAFDIRSTKAKQFGFTMYYGENKKLTCCGDEPYADHELEYAKDSDWLLHEAFCLYSQADIFSPYKKHHSTVKDACELAEKLKIKNLILYHTEDKNIKRRKELYSEEGKRYYNGNLFIPDDLEVIDLD